MAKSKNLYSGNGQTSSERARTSHTNKARGREDSPVSRAPLDIIAIVGLGYVGLPLALQFGRCGVNVLGLDIDQSKVDLVNKGKSYIKHINSSDIAELTRSKKFGASTDFSRVHEVDAVIICVPTPLNKNREPDISFIIETGKSIAPYLRKSVLIVL